MMKGSQRGVDAAGGRTEKWQDLLLILGVALAYGQTFWHGFISFDDPYYIMLNDHIQNGLTWKSISWAFTSFYMCNWHPLTWLSYMGDYRLFGLNPAGYHLVNLFFHMANALLLFLLLREATEKTWRSFWVAALFALHPLHIESVAWIAERKDVLSAFFWMLTMLAYVRYARGAKAWYLGVVGFFALGLMSKPMVVTLPFVLLLFDYWPLRRMESWRLSSRGLILEKIPLFVLSIASATVTYLAQAQGGALAHLSALALDIRVKNAVVSYIKYLGKCFYPTDLAIIYPHPGATIPAWAWLSAGIALAVITGGVLYRIKRFPFLFTGWFWYLGTLIPVIGLVQVGVQAMADRYAYLPLIGIYIGVIWFAGTWVEKLHWTPRAAFLLSAAALTGLMALTLHQASYWKNPEILYRHAIESTGGSVSAHINLGAELQQQGKLAEASRELKRAIELGGSDMAHVNLGVVYSRQGMGLLALEEFDLAIRLNPQEGFHAWFNKGSELLRMNRKSEALACFHRAAGLLENPDHLMHNAATLNRLGVFLAEAGELIQASSILEQALELSPKKPDALNNYGRILFLQGKYPEALAFLNRAVRENPQFPEAYNNLGLCLLELGSIEEALYCFAAALHIQPDYMKARTNLLAVSEKMLAAHKAASIPR